MKTKNKTLGSFAAKTHFSQILDDVTEGAEFIITKRGRPVARITPFSTSDSIASRLDAVTKLEKIRKSVKGTVNIKQFINDGRKR